MSSDLPILLFDASPARRERLAALLGEAAGPAWGLAAGGLEDLERALCERRFRLCLLGAPPVGTSAWALRDRIVSRAPGLAVLRLLGPEPEPGFQLELEGPTAPAPPSSLVHDLNNMLVVISSYASLLLDSLPDPDPNRECVLEMAEAARRAIEISERLRTRPGE